MWFLYLVAEQTENRTCKSLTPFSGWANEDCVFNPQKGIGVGDTHNSCGFDGTRCKVWSGPSVDVLAENDYGL